MYNTIIFVVVAIICIICSRHCLVQAVNCNRRNQRGNNAIGVWGNIADIYASYENTTSGIWTITVHAKVKQFTRRYQDCTTEQYTEWRDAYNYAWVAYGLNRSVY